MKEEKFTFRQRWFPTVNDAESMAQAKGDADAIGIAQIFGRWTRSIVFAGAVLWGSYQLIGNNVEYSSGERTGMINKVSEKGLFWKTYEGQIALEGIVSGNQNIGANVWDFSLDRQTRHGENTQKLVAKLREYMQNGTKVKLTYVEPLVTWPWRSGTDYLIQNVEPAGKAEKQ